MKKHFMLATAMLLASPLLLATSWTTPLAIGEISGSIAIKNTSSEDATVTCVVGSQGYPFGTPNQIIPKANKLTITATAGDGCDGYTFKNNNNIICTYITASGSGTFTVAACQNASTVSRDHPTQTYSSNLSVWPASTPPTPYLCTSPTPALYDGIVQESCDSHTSNPQSATRSICSSVQAYFAIGDETAVEPIYTLTWNNIKMNLAKGQAMAAKLSSLLVKNFTDYGHPIPSYDGTKLTIIFPPKTNPNPNPYAGTTDCQSAYSG